MFTLISEMNQRKLTNLDELSFLTVLAFPKASRIGFACSNCCSSSPCKNKQNTFSLIQILFHLLIKQELSKKMCSSCKKNLWSKDDIRASRLHLDKATRSFKVQWILIGESNHFYKIGMTNWMQNSCFQLPNRGMRLKLKGIVKSVCK